MHPKTKPKPTVHLANWCRVRCSVSHTTSWTGLSTSLATTPTPARLWQWKHLQGMHEHDIFHSPNAHKQKTYIMHIFPNMSFFHSYLHLQQLQIASVHATLHLWLTTIPSVCLDGIYDFSNTYHTSSRPLEVKTPARHAWASHLSYTKCPSTKNIYHAHLPKHIFLSQLFTPSPAANETQTTTTMTIFHQNTCTASQTLIKQAHCRTQESILHIYICTCKTEYNLAHIISKCHSSEVSW